MLALGLAIKKGANGGHSNPPFAVWLD